MSSLVSSVIFTTVSQIIKVKAIIKYGLAHERTTKFSESSLRTRVFHCQAACAPPSSSHTSTRVTWGRGCLRACASQADGDQPAPAELGFRLRWERRLRLGPPAGARAGARAPGDGPPALTGRRLRGPLEARRGEGRYGRRRARVTSEGRAAAGA